MSLFAKSGALFTAGLLACSALCSCRRAPDNEQKITKEEFARLVAKYEQKKKEEEARKNAPPEAKPKAKPKAGDLPSSGASASAEPGLANEDEAPAVDRIPAGQTTSVASRHGAGKASGPWIVDEPAPIAPAGPAAATAFGVVLYNRRDEIHLARLGTPSTHNKATATPVTAIAKSAAPFPLGRAPAVTEKHAYWVSSGRLVRRLVPVKGGDAPLEVLAKDARDGTRVAVPVAAPGAARASLPPMAAYIVRADKEDGPLLAKLWIDGAPSQIITPEGSSTHSVVLIATGDGVLAISLSARMSMTPVHARRIRFAGGAPVVEDDVVVWVGGGVQPLTEITALRSGDTVFGLLPHERSITEFGLAELDIGLKPDMDTPTRWIAYPNGLDPAPVATGYVCGESAVLYVEPSTAAPDAEQRLVLRSVDARGNGATQPIATAKGFYDVSLSALPAGALVAYVADWVTWSATVRCRPGAKRK